MLERPSANSGREPRQCSLTCEVRSWSSPFNRRRSRARRPLLRSEVLESNQRANASVHTSLNSRLHRPSEPPDLWRPVSCCVASSHILSLLCIFQEQPQVAHPSTLPTGESPGLAVSGRCRRDCGRVSTPHRAARAPSLSGSAGPGGKAGHLNVALGQRSWWANGGSTQQIPPDSAQLNGTGVRRFCN